MPPVIGLDLGNCFTFPSYISGIDEETRTGGTEYDLIPTEYGRNQEGLPSRFYFEKGMREPVVGLRVEHMKIPRGRYKDLLKRHIRESFEMGGRVFSYREAIRLLAQDCIRKANERLEKVAQQTTNHVTLAYPANYQPDDLELLKEAVQGATLDDGRHVEVVGTIREPAAAALEYLAGEMPDRLEPMTVMVFDLGGGTCDVSIVTCYPRGEKSATGGIRYYREHAANAVDDLGGEDFTDDVAELIKESLQGVSEDAWKDPIFLEFFNEETEKTKHVLSIEESYVPRVLTYRCAPITREQFEAKSSKRLNVATNLAVKMLRDHPNLSPEKIVLTGGASNMPMVKEKLQEAFAKAGLGYGEEDIVPYNPSKAISYGAARYGVPERSGGHVIQSVRRSLGIKFFDRESWSSYVLTIIPAGAEIPYAPDAWTRCMAMNEVVRPGEGFEIYEATVERPDERKIYEHWRMIGHLPFDHRNHVKNETRILIDEVGTLRAEAHRLDDPTGTTVRVNLDWEFDRED